MSGSDVTLRYLLFGQDKSASKAVEGVGSTASRTGKIVASSMDKLGNTVGGEFGNIVGQVGMGLQSIGEAESGMAGKLTEGGIALTGLGVGAQLMASKAKDAQAQLRTAIEDSGHSWEDYEGKIDKTIKSEANYAHGAADTQDALRILTTATKSPTEALSRMSLVSNLAASRHINLAAAAKLVEGAYAGNTRVLKQFGIQVTATANPEQALATAQKSRLSAVHGLTTAQQTYKLALDRYHGQAKHTAADELTLKMSAEKVTAAHKKLRDATSAVTLAQKTAKHPMDAVNKGLDELAKRTKGQASSAVNSFGGRLDVLRTKISNYADEIAQKAGPAMTALGPAMTIVGTGMQIMRTRAEAAAIAQAAETVATDTQATSTVVAGEATKGFTAAQWLMNVALEANPILLIITGLVALGVALVVAYKKSATFRAIVTGAFHAIQVVVAAVVGFIKNHWQLLLGIITGPIGLAVVFVVKHFGQIKNGAGDVISWVKGHWPLLLAILTGPFGLAVLLIVKKWHAITSFFKGLPGTIKGFLSNARTLLFHIGAEIVNGLIKGLESKAGDLGGEIKHLANKMTFGLAGHFGIKSPSTVTAYMGRMLAEGLIVGFTGVTARVKSKLASAVQAMLVTLHNEIAKAMAATQKQVTDAKSKLTDALKARSQYAAGIKSNLLSDAAISGATDQTTGKVGNIGAYLHGQVGLFRRFAGALKKLRAAKLNPQLIAQIAGDGPTAGLAEAQSILSGASGSIGSLNTDQHLISKFAGQAATTTAGVVYDKRVEKDSHNLDTIAKHAHQQTALLKQIAAKVGANPTAREMKKELKRYKRKTGGKVLGLA